MATVIHDILALVQIDTFTEYLNIYESTMDDTTGDSPLLQCGLDHELFAEDTCYTALSEILKSLNAGIRQDQGIFELFRFIEISDTMHGREFTDPTTTSYVVRLYGQLIDRPGSASNLSDMNGGTRMIIPHIKTINVNQDYGFRGGFLLNHTFDFNKFAVFDFEDWTREGSTNVNPLCYEIPGSIVSEDAKGMYMLHSESTNPPARYIYQSVSAVETTDRVIMDIEAGLWGADSGQLWIQLTSTDGVNTKDFQSVTSTWEDPTAYIVMGEYVATENELDLKKYVRLIDGIPYTGTLTVKILATFETGATDVFPVYKSISIYQINTSGIVPDGIAYVVGNAIEGQIVDREYKIGDGPGFENDHLQYKGALNVWDGSDIVPSSKSWHTRGLTQNIPLIQLIGQEWGEQYERQKDLIDLPLWEKTAATFLRINANLQDSYNVYSPGLKRIFAISRAMYDVRRREYQLSLTEIIQ